MDTQVEMRRENEAFEAGVKAFYDYIAAENDSEVNAAHAIWAEWSRHHHSMSFDAQSAARVRWDSN